MNKTKLYIICCAAFVLLFLLCAGIYQGVRRYHYRTSNLTSLDGQQHGYYVYPDTPIDSLWLRIRADYAVSSEHAFERDFLRAPFNEPKPGYYLFPAEMGNRTLFHRLRMGEQTPVKLRFNYTIRTNEQLAARLAKQLLTDSASIIALLQDDAFLSRYGLNTETARCLFLPDTYEVYWTMTAEQLFERMHREYKRVWNDSRRAQAEALHLTPEQVYTLASIVTSETTKAHEYPIIAGLYLHRLRIGMHMQACPTAVYASRKFSARRITNDIKNFPSPYNTYIHLGLPPGPIRVTQADVIDSTLHATPNNYLYMCANPDFSGTHVFSESYSKHSAVARQYQRELNKRKIRK